VRRFLAMFLCIASTSMLAAGAASASAWSTALFNSEIYDYTAAQPTTTQLQRDQAIVLNSADAKQIPVIRAAHPGVLIFMYQSVLQAQTKDPTGLTTCTPYGSDVASNPSWFLTDQHGHTIADSGYPTNYLMDVGNPAYQQACVAHADSLAQSLGFDGIYFDDVTANVAWTFAPGITCPEYPTATAWQAAMYSMITYAASNSALPIVANIGGSTAAPGLWQKWTAPLFGAEEESWTDGGAGPAQQVPFWTTKLLNVAWSEANHKLVILHSYNTSEAGNVYGLASMLLVANGESSYSTSPTYATTETWYPEYDTAQALGVPLGSFTRAANGVYERDFQNGVVLVNPTTTSIGAFTIGGGTYSGVGLTNVSQVSMGPTSALILLRDPVPAHSTSSGAPQTQPHPRSLPLAIASSPTFMTVHVSRHKRNRTVMVTLRLAEWVTVKIKLGNGRHRYLTRTLVLKAGTRRLKLGVPSMAPGGSYRLTLVFRDRKGRTYRIVRMIKLAAP
jgi:putative glycosyl hydrolase-like family 15 (GHL15) protein